MCETPVSLSLRRSFIIFETLHLRGVSKTVEYQSQKLWNKGRFAPSQSQKL